MKISKRVKHIQTMGIREIFEFTRKIDDVQDFSLGQPDFGMTAEGKKAAIEAIRSDRVKYTENQGILSLREVLAKKLKTANRIPARPEEIIVTAGATGGLALTFLTLLDPGDEVVVCDPYFPVYTELPKLLGAKIRLLDTYPNFLPDPKKLELLITNKTKLVVINTPNAPTGTVYDLPLLKSIAGIAKRHSLTVLSDEIYENFVYDGAKHFSMGSFYKNTVTVNGFAKSFGMPGMRLGYLHAPEKVVSQMIKVQQLLYCCAPTPAQYAGTEMLKYHAHTAAKIRKAYQHKKNLVAKVLSDKYDFIEPRGGFYYFIKAPSGNAAEFTKQAIKRGVALIPGRMFSKRNTHFRLAFCVPDETIKKGTKKLASFKDFF